MMICEIVTLKNINITNKNVCLKKKSHRYIQHKHTAFYKWSVLCSTTSILTFSNVCKKEHNSITTLQFYQHLFLRMDVKRGCLQLRDDDFLPAGLSLKFLSRKAPKLNTGPSVTCLSMPAVL